MVKSWIFTAIDLDSILGWGTKIPQTTVVQPKIKNLGFQGGASGKEPTCNAGALSSIPGLGRSPGERKGYPYQYPGLENSLDCIVHEVAKSRTRLNHFHFIEK